MEMNQLQLEEYKRYVSSKLNALTPVFAKASVGDFSEKVEIPDEDDEFTDLYVGVQVMLDVIRDQLSELKELNQSLEQKVSTRTSALAEAEEIYKHIVENANDIIYSVDVDGRITFFNPTANKILKYSGEEILGRHYLDFVKPEYRNSVSRFFKLQFAKKIPDTYFEAPTLAKDGSEVWLGQHVHLLLENNRIVGFQAVSRDITERKRAEDALRESEERYRNLIEAARDVIFTISPYGNISSLNSAFEWITGWSRTEWVGKPFISILHPDDVSEARERFLRMIAGEMLPPHEWRVRSKSGEYLVAEITPTPQIKGGKVVEILGIARDVTARMRAEEALRQSEIRFRSVWENSADGMRLTDEQGTIVAVNASFCKLVEMQSSDLLGHPIIITYGKDTNVQEMLEKYRQRFQERNIEMHIEHPVTLKSGKTIHIEMTNSFIELEHGHALLLGIFRDITERKRTEEIIRRRNEQLKEKLQEVERLNEIMMGREERIIELKEEIEALKAKTAIEPQPGE